MQALHNACAHKQRLLRAFNLKEVWHVICIHFNSSRPIGKGTQMKRNFTVIELLAVTSILAVLAALLLPSLSLARESARDTACTSLLKQYAYATSMYADDFDDIFPDIRKYLEPAHGFLSFFQQATRRLRKSPDVLQTPRQAAWDALDYSRSRKP